MLKNDSKLFTMPGPLRIAMNRPTEVNWIISWLPTTGTVQYYKEPGKRKLPWRNLASHTSDLQEKLQLNFSPIQPIQKNWKSPQHPLTEGFQPSSSHRSYLTLQHTVKQLFTTKLCLIFNNHLFLQKEENNQ